jgi:hypothetical protein
MSRRQAEKRTRPVEIAAREERYMVSKRERREATGFIKRDTLTENKRYWLQRYAEQWAVRHGTTDVLARRRALLPGSEFNRLWAASERQGFQGGTGSAWDAMAWTAGAKGGAADESERNKYLAVIAWYMRNDEIGEERWVDRNARGQFDWPNMPSGEVA